MPEKILIGFEVGSGDPVYMELHHLAIFGLTQKSGKTTALEAVIIRAGLKAIAFITKRGESGFTNYHLLTPYYKPRADWQFVEGLVNVALGEKVKFEPGMRYAIMKVCRGHKDLKEIQLAARSIAKTDKSAFMRSVYEKLDQYLDIVIPELDKWTFTELLELKEGANIMDLSGMRLETQHIVIASTIEYAFAYLDHVIVIIPEAWESIPQGKMTPVKWVAQQFIRKGAALGNYLFLDSIPGYETLFIRRNGLVETTTLEELFTEADGARVETSRGEVIRGFEEDIEVLSPSPNRLVWTTINKIIRHPYTGEILRINAKGGLVDVSSNHPIMKYPKYLVEAKTLKVDDRLCMRAFQEGRHHNSDVQLFIGSEDLAWFYGFFVAEGAVTGKNRKHIALYNKNKRLLERAQVIIKENFHLSASFISPRKGVYGLDVASPRLVDHLKSCYLKGAKLNKYNKMVPISMLNAPLEIKRAFFNGYIAGDGYVDKEQGYLRGLVSASRVLILGLTWLLHSCNEESTYTVHIRADKPKIVQLSVNKGKHRGFGDNIKRIVKLKYSGFLYDLGVDSKDHTFYLGIGNVRVHNSQDIGGIDKTPLRQCDNWLMGRMKEAHEVERILKQLLGAKISAEEIQTLPLGHFYAAIGNDVKKVYVLPLGVPEQVGVDVATGKRSPESVRDEFLSKIKVTEDESLYKEENVKLKTENDQLKAEIRFVNGEMDKLKQQFETEAGDVRKLLLASGEDQKKIKRLQEELTAFGKLKEALTELLPVRYASSPDQKIGLNVSLTEIAVHNNGLEKVSMNTKDPAGKIMYCALRLHQKGLNQNPGVVPTFKFLDLQEEGFEYGWHIGNKVMGPVIRQGWLIKTLEGYRLPSKLKISIDKEVT